MPRAAHEVAQRLFIVGFPDEVSEGGLKRVFEPYGQIAFVQIVRKNGPGRAYGFIDLGPPDAVEAAIRDLHGAQMDGHRLTVQRAKPMAKGSRALREVLAELEDAEIDRVLSFARDLLANRG